MSTKDEVGDGPESIVEAAKEATLAGKTERAAQLYRRAIALDSPHRSADDRFHVQRAWVNLGILLWRSENASEAIDCWNAAVRLADEHPQSARIQAAGLRAQRYLLLGCDASTIELRTKAMVERWIDSPWPEVHVQLLDFELGANQRCGLDEGDPNALWIDRALTSLPLETEPDDSFVRSYRALHHAFRVRLSQKWPQLVPWFSRLPENLRPWPPYSFETSDALVGELSNVEIVRPREEHRGVRSIYPVGKSGWTWNASDGKPFFSASLLPDVADFSRVAHVQWNTSSRLWGWVEERDPQILRTIGASGRIEVYEASDRIVCLVALRDGWFVVTRTANGVYVGGSKSSSIFVTNSDWIVGHQDTQGRIFLGSERGELGIVEPSGRLTSVALHRGRITAIASDESFVYTGGEDGRFLQSEMGKTSLRARSEHRFDSPVFSIVTHASGVWTCGGKTFLSWDRSKGTWTTTEVSSDIQSFGVDDTGSVVWADRKFLVHFPKRVQRMHANWVMTIAWNAERRTWLTADLDQTICEWSSEGDWVDTVGHEATIELKAHATYVLFRAAGWITLRTWDGRFVARAHFDGEPILSWAIEPHSRYLFLGSLEGSLGAFDLERLKWVHRVRLDDPPAFLDADQDALRVVTHNGSYFEFPPPDRKSWVPGEELNWTKGVVAGVRWSEDARALVWGPSSKTIYLFDPHRRRLTAALEGLHKKPLTDAFWDTPKSRVWTAGRDGKIAVWNCETGELEQVVREGDEAVERMVALDRVVVVRLDSKNWTLIHRGGASLGQEVPGHRGKMTAIAVAGREEVLVTSAQDAQLRLFGLPDGTFLNKYPERLGPFKDIVVRPGSDEWTAVGQAGEIVRGSVRIRWVRKERPR